MSKVFNVYSLMNIEPVKAKGMYLWDKNNTKYLDFYSGHAVVSIGHTHPVYVKKIEEQLEKIAFYSNAVQNHLQENLAKQLTTLADCASYKLFLCNSGAEANENALKLASFITKRKKILAFKSAFHGRTSAAVAITDNPSIQALINQGHEVSFVPLNDIQSMQQELEKKNYAAVIVEGIQGVGGVRECSSHFLQQMHMICNHTNTIMILDEVQSGYGRTGKFFAYQHAHIQPDIISMAKGMGNGFPIAGILIHKKIKPTIGMLGTTFGGSHLACAAGIAVLEVIANENLIINAQQVGDYFKKELQKISLIKAIRGKGLMIGIDVEGGQVACREKLLHKHQILVGYSGKETIRLLPPLIVNIEHANALLHALKNI
ncbi:MAG: aspartate aminotransferase family protein [Chitinophagaceae bacterium]